MDTLINTSLQEIPLEDISKKITGYDEKKEEYKLRYYLYYHLKKKKKAIKGGIQVVHKQEIIKFD